MEGQPLEEPHQSAWQGAVEGDVSVVTFDETHLSTDRDADTTRPRRCPPWGGGGRPLFRSDAADAGQLCQHGQKQQCDDVGDLDHAD